MIQPRSLRLGIKGLPPSLRILVFLLLFLAGALLWAGLLGCFLALQGQNPIQKISAADATIYSSVMYLYLIALTTWFWQKVEESNLEEIGLPLTFFSLRCLTFGSLFGFVMLAILRGIELFFHLANVHLPGPSLIFLSNLVVALLYALSEEVVFRGLILQTLLKGMKKNRAIMLSSGIWAIAHFIRPDVSFPGALVSMLGLWTAGILLGYAYAFTRSLWTPIGIHGGWIYFIAVSGQLNVFAFTPGGSLFHGNGSPTSGILGLFLTTVFLWVFRGFDRRKGLSS